MSPIFRSDDAGLSNFPAVAAAGAGRVAVVGVKGAEAKVDEEGALRSARDGALRSALLPEEVALGLRSWWAGEREEEQGPRWGTRREGSL